MALNRMLLFVGLACLVAQLLFAGVAAKEEAGVINLIVDMEESALAEGESPAEKENLEMNSTINLLNEVDSRDLKATISVTGDIANERYPLYITMLGTKENHELIMGGMSSGEKLVSFEDQDARLRKTRRYVEDDYVCGGKQFKVAGYLPQPNSFNQSSYKILDDLEILYLIDDTGLPESQNRAMPYLMDGFDFYVVPVSEDKGFLMRDASAKAAGMNGTDWYNLLASKFDESAGKGETMVVVFTNTISGSDEYLDAYKKFVEYATDKGASFVTTRELVESAKNA
ncbi:MAG TPA: hypothetical protein VMY43_04505 [Methanothrix sp.]|nr:hypothetical protein [Methanothrix sp.]